MNLILSDNQDYTLDVHYSNCAKMFTFHYLTKSGMVISLKKWNSTSIISISKKKKKVIFQIAIIYRAHTLINIGLKNYFKDCY